MMSPKLLVDTRDGIMTVALNRPDKLNAIDTDLSRALLDAIDSAAKDPAVRVVLLRGNGRAFCAGRDVTNGPTEEDLLLVQAVAKALVTLSKPVVAVVHGWTVGAGFEWTLNADLVIAAASSRFKLPEASIGVFVTGGLTATLPAYAGLARAKALMLLGEEFSPAQAQAWGLVWHVLPDNELEVESRRLAMKLAALQPELVSRFKRVINDVGLASFARAIELENEAQRALANGMVRSERADRPRKPGSS
jgi:2-(1,2-epoxy-1,2-dihydrophenyl)acetyl-CoA isomerase